MPPKLSAEHKEAGERSERKGFPAWLSVGKQVSRAAGPVRGGAGRGFAEPWHGIRKNGTYGGAIYPISKSVGDELSSRLVSKQVFSPLQSLTSVFGMGTGGPFAFETLTDSNSRRCRFRYDRWCTFRDSNPGPTD